MTNLDFKNENEKIEIHEEEQEEEHEFKEQSNENVKVSTLFNFTDRSDMPIWIVAIFFMCISAATTPITTYLYGEMFKDLSLYYMNQYTSLSSFMKDIRFLSGMIMCVGVIKMIFNWGGIYFWMIFGERQSNRARNQLYSKILYNHQFEWFDTKQNKMGELSQINRCIEELRSGCSETLGQLSETIASILALFIIAMFQSWSLTLVILAGIPFMAISGWYFGGMTHRAAQLENQVTAKCSKILNWNFVQHKQVKLFNARYHELIRFNHVVDKSARAYYKLAHAIALNTGVLRGLALMMFVQAFWFGNYMISVDKLKINQVFTCFSSCLILGGNISSITELLAIIHKAYASAQRISQFLVEGESIPSPKSKRSSFNKPNGIYPTISSMGKISFHDVNFFYASRSQQILTNVSFDIQAGEMNFIVGTSGSGKSSLALLLFNFYKPSSGRISIDGYSVAMLNTKWLTDNITYLQQTPAIFSGTLRDNVAMGGVGYTSIEDIPSQFVEDACDFSMLASTISELSMGIDTIVSGAKLSGGQKQRIAIARAKLRDTPILILDEALSAIDVRTKNILFSSIRQWRKGKTTIVITHDYSQIRLDEYVITIDKGKIINTGYLNDYELKNRIVPEKNDSISSKEDDSNDLKEDKSTHYIKNPVILKGLEEISTERPKEIKSVIFILKYCWKSISNKPLLLSGVFVSIIAGMVSPVFSYCFSQVLSIMVSASIGMNVKSDLSKWSCIVIGIAASDGISNYLSSYILAYASENWIINLRKLTFAKLVEQDSAYYDLDSTNAAELTALIMNDTRDLRNLVSEFISLAVNLLVLVVAGTVWAIVSGWKLALVGIAFVPCVLILTGLYSMILETSENNYKSKIADCENLVHESMSNIKSILTLDLTRVFQSRFETRMGEIKSTGYVRACHTGVGFALSGLLSALATGTILYYGMKLAGSFEYSQGRLLEVITLIMFTIGNAGNLLGKIPDIARGQRAGTYIIGLLELEQSQSEITGVEKPFRNTKELVAFNDVKFSYPTRPHDTILNKLSFKIRPGEIVALVGDSGSGKSTIASIIARLYLIEDGSVYIRGKDINEIDIEWLRNYVSLVPQSPVFFEGSVLDNLTYGLDPNTISNERLISALKMTNAYEFVTSLDNGWHTKVGEGQSSLLSGGQLQRLAISQALIRNSKLIIMDEPTSALDPENSKFIRDCISEKFMDDELTLVIISHDRKLMQACSRVIMLNKGEVTEDGSFNSVYDAQGDLYRLLSQ
ncbi:alpha-factor-transporting ATPase [[Candida] anglica]